MDKELLFFDTILLQQDMRIRLPKSVVINIDGTPGKTHLDVYLDALTKEIVLRASNDEGKNKNA